MSQHLAYINLSADDALPEFVLAYLQSQYGRLRQIASAGGSTKAALTCGLLRSLEIPLPPLGRQQEIISIFKAVDGKIAAEEQRREALNQLFRTLLHELMTGRIRLDDWDEVA